MKKIIVNIIFTFLFIIPSLIEAQNEKLEPVQSVFDGVNFDYHYLIRKILMKEMSIRPEIRFLIIPSYGVEETIAIEKVNGKYFIVHNKMEKSIWYTKKRPDKIKVLNKSVEIRELDMKLYRDLFLIAINNKEYSEKKTIRIHSNHYFFSVLDKRLKTGMIQSPKKNTRMDRLKNIGYSLIEIVKKTESGQTGEVSQKLREEIKLLTKELKTTANNG